MKPTIDKGSDGWYCATGGGAVGYGPSEKAAIAAWLACFSPQEEAVYGGHEEYDPGDSDFG